MGKLRRRNRHQDAMRAPSTAARRKPAQSVEDNGLANEQHALGNQAVQRLIDAHGVQPKLTVGAPNDAYEQEADRVANQVMGMTTPTTESAGGAHGIQRMEENVHRAGKEDDKKKEPTKKESPKKEAGGKEAGGKEGAKDKKKEDDKAKRKPIMDDEKKEEEPVQREAADEGLVPEVSPALEASLNAQSGGGQPLPDSLQSFFEPRIGADLSDVRLHTDQQAAEAAAALEAQAFTRDRDVFFGAGLYEPQSSRGLWLLAHELTHTVQQTKEAGAPDRDPQPGSAGTAFAIELPAKPLLVARKDDEEEEPSEKPRE